MHDQFTSSFTDSGLRVATHQLPEYHSVAIQIWIPTGSRHESANHNGVAHFLEHMLFKGTKKRTAKAIAEAFDMMGGDLNAFTSREYTVLHTRILGEFVEQAIEIMADIIENSTFVPEECDKERQVILEEIGQTMDNPDDLIFDMLQATAFPDQPLGRPILGTETTLNQIDTTTLHDFVATQYKGIIFSAAGNINHDHIITLCERFFTRTIAPQDATASSSFASGFHYKVRDLEQVQLVMAFPGLSYRDIHALYKVQLLSTVIGEGMSSRLFQEIREKHGLAYNIYSFQQPYRDTGLFGVYAATSAPKLEQFVPLLCETLYSVISNISNAEFQRAQSQLKSTTLMSQEQNTSIAEHMGWCYSCYGDYIPYSTLLDTINNIQKNDLIETANTLLNDSPPTVAALGPVEKMPDYDTIAAYFSTKSS